MYTESELMDKKPKELLDIVIKLQKELQEAKETIGKQVSAIAILQEQEIPKSDVWEPLRKLAIERFIREVQTSFEV